MYVFFFFELISSGANYLEISLALNGCLLHNKSSYLYKRYSRKWRLNKMLACIITTGIRMVNALTQFGFWSESAIKTKIYLVKLILNSNSNFVCYKLINARLFFQLPIRYFKYLNFSSNKCLWYFEIPLADKNKMFWLIDLR